MIRLTRTIDGSHVYVVPEHLTQTGFWNDKTFVALAGDETATTVEEDPFDVARLKAAWELRYHAEEIRGDLPVAVYMDRSNPDEPKIQFLCCAITRKLRDARAGERPTSAEPQAHDFNDLFSEIFGHAFPNDPDKR